MLYKYNQSYFQVGLFINQYGYFPRDCLLNSKIYTDDFASAPKGIDILFDATKPGKLADVFDFKYFNERVVPNAVTFDIYYGPESVFSESHVKDCGRHVAEC